MNSLRNIAIRRANRADLPAINTLTSVSTRVLCAPDYTRKQIESIMRFNFADNTQLIDDRTYFVIENAGQIVAAGGWSYRAALMANCNLDNDEDPQEILDPAVAPARLRGFFVHPHFARRGLARTLVALCERAAAGAGYSRLELLCTATARHLYLACGFSDVEWITHIFPTGVSAILNRMSKSLPVAALASSRTPQSRTLSSSATHFN